MLIPYVPRRRSRSSVAPEGVNGGEILQGTG